MPPKDRLWADPFIVYRDHRYYIFVEELLYKVGKGHIAVIEMAPDGAVQQPIKLIERPYHLSYPFVFEWNDKYFMLPESSAARSVELYECVDFPTKWEFRLALMTDVQAVDSTLFYHQNKWWLFANMLENPGASIYDELFLFYADHLLSTNWTAHPMNPIVSDVKRARPAGRIFQKNGKIYRPAQNSRFRYGYGLMLNEITVLSETDYQETLVETIEPLWDGRIKSVHTLNHAENLTCADAIWLRSRFF